MEVLPAFSRVLANSLHSLPDSPSHTHTHRVLIERLQQWWPCYRLQQLPVHCVLWISSVTLPATASAAATCRSHTREYAANGIPVSACLSNLCLIITVPKAVIKSLLWPHGSKTLHKTSERLTFTKSETCAGIFYHSRREQKKTDIMRDRGLRTAMHSSPPYLGCRITSEWFMNASTFPQRLRIWSGSEMTTGSGRLLYLLSRNSECRLKSGPLQWQVCCCHLFILSADIKNLVITISLASTKTARGFVFVTLREKKKLGSLVSVTAHTNSRDAFQSAAPY